MLHDGAPAHFSRPFRDVINDAYHGKRGRWNRTNRLAPTFTRLQSFRFLRVGKHETLLYSDTIEKGETLHQRMFCLSYYLSGTFESVRGFMTCCVHACTDLRGGRFEHSFGL